MVAQGLPDRSCTQHFNSETEHEAQKPSSSMLEPNRTGRALSSLETSLCMEVEICHALPPA